MKKPKNIEAARELIKRYREITIEDIENIDFCKFNGLTIASILTGYGSRHTCILCYNRFEIRFNALINCKDCIYEFLCGCEFQGNKNTYYAISDAEDSMELFNAFQNRADHIENLLKKWE